MPKIIYAIVLIAALVPILISCNLGGPDGPRSVTCSLDVDGSGLQAPDTRLFNSLLGAPIYYSDYIVFHVGDRISRRVLGGVGYTLVTPPDIKVKNRENVILLPEQSEIIFMAEGDIYRCGFNGANLRCISSDVDSVLGVPKLSYGGRYLCSVSPSNLHLLDLESGVWQEYPIPQPYPKEAIYDADLQKFFYFAAPTPLGNTSLYSIGLEDAEPTLLMQNIQSGCSNKWEISSNGRYFGLLAYKDNTPNKLKIYDKLSGETKEIALCFAFRFSPDGNKALYSRRIYDLADVRILDMPNNTDNLLFDGIYYLSRYSYSIQEFYWRNDGQKFFYSGQWSDRRTNESKWVSPIKAILGTSDETVSR